MFDNTSDPVTLGAAAYYNFEDDQTGTTVANLVPVGTSGLTDSNGAPALQELDGVGAALPPAANWTTGAPGGTSGGGVSFDGSGSFLNTGIGATQIGGNRGANGPGGFDYSVSAWIMSRAERIIEEVDPNTGEIISSTPTGNADDNDWWFGTGSRGIHFGIFGDDSPNNFPIRSTLQQGHWSADSTGTTVVPVNTWVHATYTYDADGGDGVAGTGLMTIYYNGVVDGETSVNAPDRSASDLIIGARNGGTDGWDGVIDDVAIFQSVLTPGQVTTLFDDASQAVTLGAVAYYNFDDDQTGSTAANLVPVDMSNLTRTDGSPALQELDRIGPANSVLLGDVNLSGNVSFADIGPFITLLGQTDAFQAEADTNEDGFVTFGDIGPFITILGASQ